MARKDEKYYAVMKLLDDKALEFKSQLNEDKLDPETMAEYSMKYHFLCDLVYEIQEKLEND